MGAACACADGKKDPVVEAVPVQECFTEKVQAMKGPKLTVTVVGARGLRGAEWLPGSGKPDCYCELRSEGLLLHSTAFIPNTVEPTWLEAFEVTGVASGSALTFAVCDKDPDGADTLGKATLESKDYEKEGFNGELQLQGAGAGQAYLRVKVKLDGVALPPSAPAEIAVTVEKPSQDRSFGLCLDSGDGVALHVMSLGEGPFTDYNKGVAPALQLREGDVIVSANGIKGDSEKMLTQFTDGLKVECRVKRTVLTAVVFDASTDSMIGLELPADMQGDALVIRGIEGGAVKRHNQSAKPADRLYVGDRIVSVAGLTGSAEALKEKLVAQKGKMQLVIRRIAALEPETEGSKGVIHFIYA